MLLGLMVPSGKLSDHYQFWGHRILETEGCREVTWHFLNSSCFSSCPLEQAIHFPGALHVSGRTQPDPFHDGHGERPYREEIWGELNVEDPRSFCVLVGILVWFFKTPSATQDCLWEKEGLFFLHLLLKVVYLYYRKLKIIILLL